MAANRASRIFASTIVLALTFAAIHARGGSTTERYGLTQPLDLRDDQWEQKLKEIDAIGRLRDGSKIPWDFKVAGGVRFEGSDFGLTAPNREAIARSMDKLLNLEAPYKEAYCSLTLHIAGAFGETAETRKITRRRAESVKFWFVEHGYDQELIVVEAFGGVGPQDVEWEIEGGLMPSQTCNATREKQRASIKQWRGI